MEPARDATYIAQLSDFIAGRAETACSAREGLWACKVVAAAEASAATDAFRRPADEGVEAAWGAPAARRAAFHRIPNGA